MFQDNPFLNGKVGRQYQNWEKIVALSAVFNVTTDYLLKLSEIDDLSVKTEMLEKQQQMILIRYQRRRQILECVACSVAVYLIFLQLISKTIVTLDFKV